MKVMYSTLKIGLITFALMASQPHITLAENSRVSDKAGIKAFNELMLEKAREEDFEGMEYIINRQLSALLQETKELNSGLEQCVKDSNGTKREECHLAYTLDEWEINKQKGQVDNSLNNLAKKKYMEGDYEGAEATLNTELSLISKEIETCRFGLSYCSVHSKETIEKACNQTYDARLNLMISLKARVFYSLGLTNEKKPDIDSALKYYRQALDLDPGNAHYIKKLNTLRRE